MLALMRSQLNVIPSRTAAKDFMDETVIAMELGGILAQQNIRVVFQPIVSLTDGTVLGYEALSRGPEGSILERPDMLFPAAARFNLVWELEYLCRSKALERAKTVAATKKFFINVDPKIINDMRFQKGATRDILERHGIDATNIIFEITEKTAIEDYQNFRRVLDNYVSQGYKIAIDDTGSGYSGLRTLVQTHPHYIKIDMDLVRGIDKDAMKQALVKSLYDFSVLSNSKIIAEGIETEDELATIINIGIPYGQGYLLQRPAANFSEIDPKVQALIQKKYQHRKRQFYHFSLTVPVGELARQDIAFSSDQPCRDAIEFFNVNPTILGIPIVDNEKPVGLLMKQKLLTGLATQFGMAVYMNRPIRLLMDNNPLIVDYCTPLDQVSQSALARVDDNIYDYIIITKEEKYFGTTTVKRLLEKTTQLELKRAKYSNPLTGLPGNIVIEAKLQQILSQKHDFAVLYFDVDNFKSYNDVYGFENGDKILCLTAEIIKQHLEYLEKDYFLGHIGGDDFVAIAGAADLEALCQRIIADFDTRIPDFYTQQDKERGFIVAKNRHGIEERFPLVTLSIAVVTNRRRMFNSTAQLAEAAGVVKKKCKLTWRSCYRID